MTTETINPSREFASAVRLALSDLPPEEVDELTDGLEADLAERAEDDAAPDFGDPMEYANELRLAADLPPRSRATSRELSAWADFVQGLRELRATPFVSSLANFFVALRPVWWLIRAWAFYGILCWAAGAPSLQVTPLTFALGVGTVVVSVQFGRGKWLPREWMRVTLRVVNIVLIVMIPVIFVVTVNAFVDQTNAAYNQGTRDGEHEQNGLEYNGRSVSNIFAYDANGQPLTQVQLYDQSGHPLYTVPDRSVPTSDYDSYLVPNALVHGRGGWNVYPLGFVSAKDLTDNGTVKKGVKPEQSTLPDLAVPPLKNAPNDTTPAASPTPTATPAP